MSSNLNSLWQIFKSKGATVNINSALLSDDRFIESASFGGFFGALDGFASGNTGGDNVDFKVHWSNLVLNILFIQSLWLLGTSAFAQSIEDTGYQEQQSIGDSSTCAPQCILKYTAVPNDKRFVITHVSAQLGSSTDIIVLEGGNGTLFVTKPYETASYLSAPVTFYYNSGETPTARMFIPNSNDHTSLIVTLIGHLIPSGK